MCIEDRAVQVTGEMKISVFEAWRERRAECDSVNDTPSEVAVDHTVGWKPCHFNAFFAVMSA